VYTGQKIILFYIRNSYILRPTLLPKTPIFLAKIILYSSYILGKTWLTACESIYDLRVTLRRFTLTIATRRAWLMTITPDLPFLNIHNLFTNKRISVYLDKHFRMSLEKHKKCLSWGSTCFCVILCVFLCTGHFVMVSLNLTCLHCLQHSFFEHLFNLYLDTED